MAEARPTVELLRRPWHGASDRLENPGVIAIRLHRAEVEALMIFHRSMPGSDDQRRAWRRLAALREKRVALMAPDGAKRLPPLPAPPADALSGWQKLRRRLGFARN